MSSGRYYEIGYLRICDSVCMELMKLMDEYKIPVKIRVCDTMGYGVNFPGAVIPRSIPGIIYGLMTHAGVPSELIEFHGHNDFL